MTEPSPPQPSEPAPQFGWVPPSPATAAPEARPPLPGTLLATGVIFIVFGVLAGLIGGFVVFVGAVIGQFSFAVPGSGLSSEQMSSVTSMARTMFLFFGAVVLAFAVGHLAGGIGILRRRGWARILGLVLSVLAIVVLGLGTVSSILALTQSLPGAYFDNSYLTVEEYRRITVTSAIFSMAIIGAFLAAYLFVTVVLIRRGRDFN
jgi:membrane protease YdiL (CAAX protease family)